MEDKTFNEIRFEIGELSDRVNEGSVARTPDLNMIEGDCIDLMAACSKMVQYCGENK